jgi:hypothetical protein
MRAILVFLILAVVVLIVLVSTGLLDINQTRSAKAPDIDASREGISASGGQTPAFDVETGSVTVGTQPANVQIPVPSLQVAPANEQAPAPANAVTNAQ